MQDSFITYILSAILVLLVVFIAFEIYLLINKRKLKKMGWKVIDVWECTLKKKNLEKTFNKLERLIAA